MLIVDTSTGSGDEGGGGTEGKAEQKGTRKEIRSKRIVGLAAAERSVRPQGMIPSSKYHNSRFSLTTVEMKIVM